MTLALTETSWIKAQFN